MKINTDLLLEVRERVVSTTKDDDEFYDQTMWATKKAECGTSYCVAGWAVHLSGLEVRWDNQGFGGAGALAFRVKDGRWISDAAQELLGLDREQAAHLFRATNSKAYVLEMLDGFIEEGKAQAA